MILCWTSESPKIVNKQSSECETVIQIQLTMFEINSVTWEAIPSQDMEQMKGNFVTERIERIKNARSG